MRFISPEIQGGSLGTIVVILLGMKLDIIFGNTELNLATCQFGSRLLFRTVSHEKLFRALEG